MSIIIAGGAGADGKTTVLELVARFLAGEHKNPLAIDANPDQTLLSFLGVGDAAIEAHPYIRDEFDFLRRALEWDNPDLVDAAMPDRSNIVDTSPVTPHSKRVVIADPADPVMQKLTLHHDGIRVMHTGTYNASDLGGKGCLHTKIAPLIFMLQRLYDGKKGEDGVVMVDNAHGKDSFGTSLYAQGDAVLVVARPNMKSAGILRGYLEMAEEVGKKIGFTIPVIVVGNSLSQDPAEFAEEEKFLRDIAGASYFCSLREDPALKRRFTNTGPSLDKILPENYQSIAKIAAAFETLERIPERRKKWMDFCHAQASWQDILTAPGISSQKSDFIPDQDDPDTYQRLHHRHGPGCNHG